MVKNIQFSNGNEHNVFTGMWIQMKVVCVRVYREDLADEGDAYSESDEGQSVRTNSSPAVSTGRNSL